jgi:hypothetical protein
MKHPCINIYTPKEMIIMDEPCDKWKTINIDT